MQDYSADKDNNCICNNSLFTEYTNRTPCISVSETAKKEYKYSKSMIISITLLFIATINILLWNEIKYIRKKIINIYKKKL